MLELVCNIGTQEDKVYRLMQETFRYEMKTIIFMSRLLVGLTSSQEIFFITTILLSIEAPCGLQSLA